jgi:hypothetical protein
MIDIQDKKNKIIKFLDEKGPSLPVQIAKAIEMDPVFASAILSELLSSKQVKTSNLRVGSSPLYLIPGQEEKLEEKTEHLKSIEKEAQEKLKEKIIIIDENEEPATRVALRNIKDFATPFKFQEKITWKYAFASQEEIDKILFPKKEDEEKASERQESKEKTKEAQEEVPKAWEAKKEEIKKAKEESKKVENIFEEKKEDPQKKEEKQQKHKKTFLEEIEEFLESKETTIEALEEVDKKKVIAKVKSSQSESMLFAFNKAKVTEAEILTCYREAEKKKLPYQIITKKAQTKKLQETMRAYKRLLKIHQLEK